MAVIPLQVASRSLDTGNVVSYPGGGEVGRALQGAGNELSQVADHFKAVQDQQARFDAGVVDDELRQRIAETEAEAARNAPADGSGIHDSVYGQIDPATGKVVKPGAFDALFDEYAQRVPESQRANFMATKQAMMLAGSNRLAAVQHTSRQAYEQVQLTKSQDTLLNGILQSDPNDTKTFEAFKQNGLDRIAASGMSALDKEKAAYNWQQSATKGLFQAMLEKDPSFAGKARAALGLAPVETQKEVAPSAGGPGGAARSGSLIQRGRGIANYFQQKGMSPVAAAGIAGALMQENAGNFGGRAGDSGISHGAAQWNGARFEGLKSFAASRGKEWTDGQTQMDYVLWEMDNGDAGARRAGRELRAATTVEQAATAMMHFERPQGYSPDNPTAGHAFGNRLRYAKEVAGENPTVGVLAASGQVDPRFANLDPDARLSLANQADVQYRQQQAVELATQKADYTAYKDRFELGIVAGQVTDAALITGDKTLNDGDKASLLRSFNEQNKGVMQLQADLGALNGNALSLDPYSSEDKKRADNLYSAGAKSVPAERQADLASAIIQQTGVVPQPIINDMRRGLSSQNPGQVIAAAQQAQKIAAYDPAVLGRRDGGSEVQKAADDFSYYVDKLNLPPEEAARRMIDNASPEKQRDRKALKPAADEFLKTMGDVDLSAEFKDGGIFSGAPALGLDPMQAAGIKADFLAIAEDQFYSANGDPDLAKNRALEQMKALYGVSRLSGAPTVVKYPPERYWPKQDSSGGPFGIGADPFLYAKTQLNNEIADFSGRGPAGPITTFDGRITAGNIDLANRPQVKNPDGSISTVRSMSYQNDAGEEVLIPTVSDEGKVMTNDEAIKYWGEKGQYLGKFDTPEHATAYAEALHKTQEQFYRGDLAIDPATVRLVTTPETEADVKAGRLPGYAVMWKDANGNFQTIPGKVWRPDTTNMLKNQQQNRATEQSDATDRARKGMEINKNIIEGVPRVLEGAGMQNNPIMQPGKPEPGSNIPTDIPAPADGADPYAIGNPM